MTQTRTASIEAPAAPARRDLPTPPADLYGELFVRVQAGRVFGDGKVFADAVPRKTTEAILADFHAEDPRTPEALRAFVTARFDLPGDAVADRIAGKDMRDHIARTWQRLERRGSAASGSELALPEPYVVPGGRFREIYYWDSYFTMLGLAADGRHDLVRAMLHNFESLVERYGHIPNGTRTYYLSRSQPPFLALMMELVPTTDAAEKRRRLTLLKAEYAYWMDGGSAVALPDGSRLNRYWDDRDSPRDESFAEDMDTAVRSGRPAPQVWRNLRAGAASGWDFTSRWLADPQDLASIHTTDILPVDLNCLLWRLETAIAGLSDGRDAAVFGDKAAQRAAAIRRHMWRVEEGRFADYDWRNGRPTPVLSAATLYPLFTGLATAEEAEAVAATVRDRLLATGGLRTTTLTTGQQWDAPNGWAPLQWIAVVGLERYGQNDLARDIARRWLVTAARTFTETGKMHEKYDVEHIAPGGGGEYPVQDGFGWTNGVVAALMERYPDLATEIAP